MLLLERMGITPEQFCELYIIQNKTLLELTEYFGIKRDAIR